MNLELTFRVALPNDFDEVMEIMATIIFHISYVDKDGQFSSCVCLFNIKRNLWVWLCIPLPTKEKQQLICRPARTFKEYRGQGVYSQLSQAMDDFIRRQYPSVRRVRFISPKSLPVETKLVQLETFKYCAKKKTLHSHHFSTTKKSTQIEACTK